MATAAAATANCEMQSLIRVINELHDALASTGTPVQMDLPQIAVVGGQSAGKSSVLENIAGRDFLPRGSDIVTRRPLVLQMYNNSEEYAEFLHEPGKRYTDYDAIRQEIEAETERVAKGKNVSSQPINLKWYSPQVVDLTLVDLPGLTKNHVGDQDPYIVQQIRDMVIAFIQPENTIILAVSPANQDIANSDAIQVARLVDPEGDRTIGVLTKLDLMDAGTDAREILENRLLPLKRGYIGVVNRSQKDINERKRIEEARSAESHYFRTHPSYRHMADRMGTKYLQRTLNQLLHAHIKDKLPGIRASLMTKKRDLAEKIREMGGSPDKVPSKLTQFTYHLLKFQSVIEREIFGHRLDVDINAMSIGVMINKAYYQEIDSFLTVDVRPDPDQVMRIMSNLAGVQNQLFPSEQAIQIIVAQLVRRYEDPLKQSCMLVAGLMSALIDKASKEVDYVPSHQKQINILMNEKIQEFQELTRNFLLSYVEAEATFINTKHPDFRFRSTQTMVDLEIQAYDDANREVGNPPNERHSRQQTAEQSTLRPAARAPAVPNHEERALPVPMRPSPKHSSQRPNSKFYGTAAADDPPAGDPAHIYDQPNNAQGRRQQVLCTGMMSVKIHHTAARTKWGKVEKERFHFVLTTSSLSWFKNPKEDEIKGTIPISPDIVCQTGSDSRGQTQFTVRRSVGGSLCPPDIEILELTPIFEDEAQLWSSVFKETSMRVEAKQDNLRMNPALSSGGYTVVTVPSQQQTMQKTADWLGDLHADPMRVAWRNDVVALVEDYMSIVDKTVRDLTPKYLNTFLVYKTVDYVKRQLNGDLLGETQMEERLAYLMTASSDLEKKKAEYSEVHKATENALKIIGELSTSGSHLAEKPSAVYV